MKVTLVSGSAGPYTTWFEPNDHKWIRQNQLHMIWHNPTVPAPFDKVFVKRWEDRAATGDALIRAAIGTKIAGTPGIYGCATDGRDHFYFIECLPPSYKKLSDLIARSTDSVIKRSVAQRLLNQSCITFQKLNEQGFIYCDLRSDNVMFSAVARSISFIDLDSCMSTASLIARKGKPPDGIDIAHWGLFNTYVPHADDCNPLELQKTLVLSSAAIWARAVAVYALSEHLAARKLLTNPVLSEQLELWNAIKSGQKAGFERYFRLRHVGDQVFLQWCNLFENFSSLRTVEWNAVRSAAKSLLDDVEATDALKYQPSPIRPQPVHPRPPISPPVPPPVAPKPKGRPLYWLFAVLVLVGIVLFSHTVLSHSLPFHIP